MRLEQPHVVRLEARPANAEGTGAVSVRELVRSALRMRPDRIIVGEVRGGEALDMLQACNTGHDGSLSTVHANSPDDALARIETLALGADVLLPLPAIRRQLMSAIDAIVQVRRGPRRAARDRRGWRSSAWDAAPTTRALLDAPDERLVAVRGAGPARPAHRDRPRPGVARVHGRDRRRSSGCTLALFVRAAARRYAVADRLRSDRARTSSADAGVAARSRGARPRRRRDRGGARVARYRRGRGPTLVAGVVGLGFGGPQIAVGLVGLVVVGAPGRGAHDARAPSAAASRSRYRRRSSSWRRSCGRAAPSRPRSGRSRRGESALAPDMAAHRYAGTARRVGRSRHWPRGRQERGVAGVDASAGALAMCSTVGGRSADALDGLATSLRDRLGVAAEARALSSQARMSAFVVGGAPVVYIAWSAVVDPHALHVLTGTLFGRVCLVRGSGSGRRSARGGCAASCAAGVDRDRPARNGLGRDRDAAVRSRSPADSRPPTVRSASRRGADAVRTRRGARSRGLGRGSRSSRRSARSAACCAVPGDRAGERRVDDELARQVAVAVDLVGVGVAAGHTPYLAVAARRPLVAAARRIASSTRPCGRARSGQSFDDALREMGRRSPATRGLADTLRTSARLGSPAAPALVAARIRTARRLTAPRRSSGPDRSGPPLLPARGLHPARLCAPHRGAGGRRRHHPLTRPAFPAFVFARVACVRRPWEVVRVALISNALLLVACAAPIVRSRARAPPNTRS